MCKKTTRKPVEFEYMKKGLFQIILSFDFYVLFNKLLDTVLFIDCTSAC